MKLRRRQVSVETEPTVGAVGRSSIIDRSNHSDGHELSRVYEGKTGERLNQLSFCCVLSRTKSNVTCIESVDS